MSHSCKRYFTLVELLVALVILSALIGGVSYYQLAPPSTPKGKKQFAQIVRELNTFEMLSMANSQAMELFYSLESDTLLFHLAYGEQKLITFDKLRGVKQLEVENEPRDQGSLVFPTHKSIVITWQDGSTSILEAKVQHEKD
jgi:prepilin-type N-terminal cleavage/methylation domain-containing protein